MAYTSLSRSSPGLTFSTATQQLQNDLLKLGFTLPQYGADGEFGAETEQAVKDFQYTWGIGVDGIVGSQTAAAIKEAINLLEQGRWNPQTDPSRYTISYIPEVTTKPPVIQPLQKPPYQAPALTLASILPQGGLFGVDWKWIGLGAFAVMAIWWINSRR